MIAVYNYILHVLGLAHVGAGKSHDKDFVIKDCFTEILF